MRLFLLLMCLATCANAKTLIIQSNEVSVAYGNAIAQKWAADTPTRLIMVRDFANDVNDNRALTLVRATRMAKDYDNLIVLGFNEPFAENNVTLIPLYANIDIYAETLKRIIHAFDPVSTIHIVCNSWCPTFGETHRVNTAIQLRILLSELNKKDNVVIVNALTSVLDEDRGRPIFGEEVSELFMLNKHLEFSLFQPDKYMAVSLWITPQSIYDKSLTISIDVNLQRIQQLNKQLTMFRAIKTEAVKVTK